jgi:multiple sugar transport system substrate-binding protein
MNGYYDNLALQAQLEYLRIPGAAEYWHELDVRVSAVLAGQTTAKAALDDTYKSWEQITESCGRESQKKLYQASFVS